MTAQTRRRSTGLGASRSRTNGSAHSSTLIGSSRSWPPVPMHTGAGLGLPRFDPDGLAGMRLKRTDRSPAVHAMTGPKRQ